MKKYGDIGRVKCLDCNHIFKKKKHSIKTSIGRPYCWSLDEAF